MLNQVIETAAQVAVLHVDGIETARWFPEDEPPAVAQALGIRVDIDYEVASFNGSSCWFSKDERDCELTLQTRH